MKSYINILSIAVVCIFSCCVSAQKPNVIFIVVDDLGWRDTGCYGSTFYETPNVDRLAASGMLFTNAYSANPLCSPTRASIMTGQYPARLGFTAPTGHIKGDHKSRERMETRADERAAGPSSVNHLSLEYYTLGKAMKDAGYATAFLGKWHMGFDPCIPENHGFDYVIGGRQHPGPPGTNPLRKFYPPWSGNTLIPNPKEDIHIDDYLGNKAVSYINEHKDRPFFMCLWFYDVHAPFQSKEELIKKWKTKTDTSNPQHCPTMAAMIEVMDNNVGRVLDALQMNEIEDHTIVIFTSDNGGNMYDVADGTTPTSNAPLRSGKGNSYEGGVRIPLIIRWPGRTKLKSVNHSIISTVDHYPSILEMTGQKIRPQDHKDGVSYVPALESREHDRGPILCDFTHFVPATMNIPNSTLRDGDWKLYRFWYDGAGRKHRYELYNLVEDIGEKRNLAAAHPEKVKLMAAQIDSIRSGINALNVHPNKKYNGRTFGVWQVNGNGQASARDGILEMRSERELFAASTRVTPNLPNGAVLEFQARSSKESPVSVEWTCSSQRKFGQPQLKAVQLTKTWKNYSVQMPFKGRIRKIRFVLRGMEWAVDLRDVRLLTAQGTVMTEYAFY